MTVGHFSHSTRLLILQTGVCVVYIYVHRYVCTYLYAHTVSVCLFILFVLILTLLIRQREVDGSRQPREEAFGQGTGRQLTAHRVHIHRCPQGLKAW